VRSINDGVVGSEKKGTQGRDEILVPLTTSLYVKGRLVDREKVLVDVGTGYYVEKVGFSFHPLGIGRPFRPLVCGFRS
jgi:prefoldin alpha subunit